MNGKPSPLEPSEEPLDESREEIKYLMLVDTVSEALKSGSLASELMIYNDERGRNEQAARVLLDEAKKRAWSDDMRREILSRLLRDHRTDDDDPISIRFEDVKFRMTEHQMLINQIGKVLIAGMGGRPYVPGTAVRSGNTIKFTVRDHDSPAEFEVSLTVSRVNNKPSGSSE